VSDTLDDRAGFRRYRGSRIEADGQRHRPADDWLPPGLARIQGQVTHPRNSYPERRRNQSRNQTEVCDRGGDPPRDVFGHEPCGISERASYLIDPRLDPIGP
jgi:hypothetical protein